MHANPGSMHATCCMHARPSQAGVAGLARGIERWDPSRRSRLSTCAWYSVLDAVRKASQAQQAALVQPMATRLEQQHLGRVADAFAAAHGRCACNGLCVAI